MTALVAHPGMMLAGARGLAAYGWDGKLKDQVTLTFTNKDAAGSCEVRK